MENTTSSFQICRSKYTSCISTICCEPIRAVSTRSDIIPQGVLLLIAFIPFNTIIDSILNNCPFQFDMRIRSFYYLHGCNWSSSPCSICCRLVLSVHSKDTWFRDKTHFLISINCLNCEHIIFAPHCSGSIQSISCVGIGCFDS
jgi:hypothetical protein